MNDLINWLNGKKTMLGILAKAILKLMGQLKPESLSMTESLDGYVDLWIGMGLVDKVRKMEVKKGK